MFGQVASSRETQHARYACVFNVLSDHEQTWPTGNTSRSHRAFIYILSDNLLLKIFYLCRPVVSYEDNVDNNRILGGRKWNDELWWYKTAQVCRKWRYLALDSASHLDLHLFCTYGTPVADMLKHSPLLPLIIDYGDEDREVTAQDEEGILLALRRRRRVRRIRLGSHISKLRKLVVAIDGEFPVLEYLYIKPVTNDDNGLILPETFRAPHLRRFSLRDVTYSPDMLYLLPPAPRIQPSERIDLCAQCNGPQMWRYVQSPSSLSALSACK